MTHRFGHALQSSLHELECRRAAEREKRARQDAAVAELKRGICEILATATDDIQAVTGKPFVLTVRDDRLYVRLCKEERQLSACWAHTDAETGEARIMTRLVKGESTLTLPQWSEWLVGCLADHAPVFADMLKPSRGGQAK